MEKARYTSVCSRCRFMVSGIFMRCAKCGGKDLHHVKHFGSSYVISGDVAAADRVAYGTFTSLFVVTLLASALVAIALLATGKQELLLQSFHQIAQALQ